LWQSIEQMKENVAKCIDNGDAAGALETIDDALSDAEGDGELYFLKGLASEALSDQDSAITAFEVALDMMPGAEIIYCKLISILSNCGRFEHAEDIAIKALQRGAVGTALLDVIGQLCNISSNATLAVRALTDPQAQPKVNQDCRYHLLETLRHASFEDLPACQILQVLAMGEGKSDLSAVVLRFPMYFVEATDDLRPSVRYKVIQVLADILTTATDKTLDLYAAADALIRKLDSVGLSTCRDNLISGLLTKKEKNALLEVKNKNTGDYFHVGYAFLVFISEIIQRPREEFLIVLSFSRGVWGHVQVISSPYACIKINIFLDAIAKHFQSDYKDCKIIQLLTENSVSFEEVCDYFEFWEFFNNLDLVIWEPAAQLSRLYSAKGAHSQSRSYAADAERIAKDNARMPVLFINTMASRQKLFAEIRERFPLPPQLKQSQGYIQFLHLNYSGGLSMMTSAQNALAYRDAASVKWTSLEENFILAKQALERPTDTRTKLSYFHAGIPLHKLVDLPYLYFTVLRNPLSQFIGSYFYSRNLLKNGTIAADEMPYMFDDNGNMMSLRDYSENALSAKPLLNITSSSFGDILSIGAGGDDVSVESYQSYRYEQNLYSSQDDFLQDVASVLQEHFLFAGVMEYFDESLVVMSAFIGDDRVSKWQSGASSNSPFLSDLDPDILTMVRDRLAPNIVAYEHVREQFNARIDDLRPLIKSEFGDLHHRALSY